MSHSHVKRLQLRHKRLQVLSCSCFCFSSRSFCSRMDMGRCHIICAFVLLLPVRVSFISYSCRLGSFRHNSNRQLDVELALLKLAALSDNPCG